MSLIADPDRGRAVPTDVDVLWDSPFAEVEVLNTTNRGGMAVADVVLPLARGQVFGLPTQPTLGGSPRPRGRATVGVDCGDSLVTD